MRDERWLSGEPRPPRGCDAAVFNAAANRPVRSARTVSVPCIPARIALTRATISPPDAFPHECSFEARAHIVHHLEFSPCKFIALACL